MDNIIQLLVIFFIIYAILSPILGKKKPQKPNGQSPNPGPNQRTRPISERSYSDAIDEIFGLKYQKTELPNTTVKLPESQYQQIPTVDYDTDLKTNYKNLETSTKMPDIDYDNLPALGLSGKAEILQVLPEPKQYSSRDVNEKTKKIQMMLKDPKTFKNLFLVTEVINKPKAFRK